MSSARCLRFTLVWATVAGLQAGCGSATTAPDAKAGTGGAGASGGQAGGGQAGTAGATGGAPPCPDECVFIPGGWPCPLGTPSDCRPVAAPKHQGVKRVFLGKQAAEVFEQAYSIDGRKFSDPEDPTHCKLQPGGKKKDVVLDGPKGEDNSFGKNIVPILLGLEPGSEELANDAISAGDQTLVIRVEGLGGGNNYPTLPSELLSVVAATDANGQRVPVGAWQDYKWAPRQDFVGGPGNDGTLHSVVTFPGGSLVDNLWSSGKRGTFRVALPLFPGAVVVTIYRGMMTMKVSADRWTSSLGIMSGVVDPDELGEQLVRGLAKLTPVLCEGDVIDNIMMQVRGASDIMTDGTQGSGEPCNGISLGLGFETERTSLGPATVAPALTDGCAGGPPSP